MSLLVQPTQLGECSHCVCSFYISPLLRIFSVNTFDSCEITIDRDFVDLRNHGGESVSQACRYEDNTVLELARLEDIIDYLHRLRVGTELGN